MNVLNSIKGLDIYLLDQLLKGRINRDHKVLDAGCGSGRNLIPIYNFGFDIQGIDPNQKAIEKLKQNHPNLSNKLVVSSIEDFKNTHKYDFVICNAVLHFAKSHNHFINMFGSLVNMINQKGILFIRMTSNFANNKNFQISETGISNLPDGSTRYLLTEEKFNFLLNKHELNLLEPLKTVNVNDLRCMTNLVLGKRPKF